jgi:hypothetical protein
MNVELKKIRTIRGGYVFVACHELESTRTLLRLYNRNGERVRGENACIHRGNLDPNGSSTAEINKGLSILGRDFDGYARSGDVKREIKRLKQNLDDYNVIQYCGRWIGRLKSEPMPVG